jgi:hypothetical protein
MCAAEGFPRGTEYSVRQIALMPPSLRMLRCHAAFYVGENNAPAIAVLPDPLPRLQLVPHYAVIADSDARLARLTSDSFDPRREVILEKQPFPQPQSNATGTAQVTRAGTDELEIAADVTAPMILLITDAYSNGWRASALEGSAQQQYDVLPANHMLRAVPLSAGKHRLLLEYAPLGYRVGRWMTVASLLVSIAGAGLVLRKKT